MVVCATRYAGQFKPECLVSLHRNRWSIRSGIGGQFDRNTQYISKIDNTTPKSMASLFFTTTLYGATVGSLIGAITQQGAIENPAVHVDERNSQMLDPVELSANRTSFCLPVSYHPTATITYHAPCPARFEQTQKPPPSRVVQHRRYPSLLTRRNGATRLQAPGKVQPSSPSPTPSPSPRNK